MLSVHRKIREGLRRIADVRGQLEARLSFQLLVLIS